MSSALQNPLTNISEVVRAVARMLIGGCIFIYSCFARQISFQIEFDLKRNSSGRNEYMHEYTPPPQINVLATALEVVFESCNTLVKMTVNEC